MHEELKKHKRHRNILYTLVFILVAMQIVSFTVVTLNVSAIRTDSARELEMASAKIQNLSELIENYNTIYQIEFREVSDKLNEQEQEQDSFKEEINLIKSSKEDFSGVIENAVKSVVSVGTDKSIGSGFIVNDEGYVVTNYHVIQGGEGLRVLMYDDKVLSASLIGADVEKDLALLKIESSSYDGIDLADSDGLKVGEKVIAIGNPLGLSFSVSEGIISGLEREGPNGLNEYIQTDVSLNPGNSGGPLIDVQGRVIGINNFKIGNTEGLGFALESDSIKESLNKIAGKTII